MITSIPIAGQRPIIQSESKVSYQLVVRRYSRPRITLSFRARGDPIFGQRASLS